MIHISLITKWFMFIDLIFKADAQRQKTWITWLNQVSGRSECEFFISKSCFYHVHRYTEAVHYTLFFNTYMYSCCLHCALGPSRNFGGPGGPLRLCVCMSDAVTQQGVTALSDSPPHGPVCLPTSRPNLTFTSILVLHTCTDVAPIWAISPQLSDWHLSGSLSAGWVFSE